jgi:MOSC domain-containing protein YiiM
LTGDVQADRRVHGGPEKAVHQYPVANLLRLRQRFPEIAAQFVPGSMGENISTPDWDESGVCIGDVFRLGSARVQLNQPRTPCWKIDARHGHEGITRFIAEEGIAGWYYRVLEPGRVVAGDSLELLERNADAISLREFWTLNHTHRPAPAALARLISTRGLNPDWRGRLQARLDWLRSQA